MACGNNKISRAYLSSPPRVVATLREEYTLRLMTLGGLAMSGRARAPRAILRTIRTMERDIQVPAVFRAPFQRELNTKDAQRIGSIIAEPLALRNDRTAVDLNDTITGHFPTYDNSTPTAVRSVKTHHVGDIVTSYRDDFRWAMGVINVEKFNLAAELLFGLQDTIPVPAEIQRATSVQEVKDYLSRSAQLQIPLEHVEMVRSALRQDIQDKPHLFGLVPSQVTPDLVERMVQRVVPIQSERGAL